MVDIYFKRLEKNEDVNWDDFDDILQQVVQYCMENGIAMQSFITQHELVMTHFSRRAIRFEFPALRWIVYLNFSCLI